MHEGRYSEGTFCCAYKREAGRHSGCYGGLYRENDINEKVERAITEVAGLTGALSDIMERKQEKDAKAPGKPDVDSLRRETAKIKAENIRMYEDYTDGKIRREEYISRKNVQSERLRQLEEEIKKAESQMWEREETLSALNQLTEEGTMLDKGISSLEDVISDFVETLYLYNADNMKIVFKCEDVIQSALEQCGEDADEALSWWSDNNAGDWLSGLQGGETMI